MWVAGSGKTTLLNKSWLLEHANFVYVPSFTTRALRAWEVNWVKYIHIDHDQFTKKIENNEFLEYATVHQVALYGTEYESIIKPLHTWKNSIKEIDMYWLIKIQEEHRIDDLYTTIFLDIPLEIMKIRILQRQQIAEDELAKRIQSALFEKAQAVNRCNFIIDATQPIETVCDQVNKICLSL